MQNLQSIINQVRKKSAHTKIAISSILIRKDKKDMKIKVKDLNTKLKSLCDEMLIDYISHENIDESCLGIKKLH